MSDQAAKAEVQRLMDENARLQARLEADAKPRRQRLRGVAAAVLAFLTALLLVFGVVAGWTSRTALDTQKFVARVGPVIDDPEVRAAMATEISNQLIDVLNLPERLRPVLPDSVAFLAIPISSAVENVVRKQVTKVVDGPRFRTLWYAALTLSHEQVVTALTGSDAQLQVVNGKVVVNLVGVVREVVVNLANQLPTIFGTSIADKIPENVPVDQIRSLLSQYLGIDLPPGFAQVPIMDASALESARTGVKVVNLSVVLVEVLALLSLVLAIVVSVRRRRTILQIGLWTAGITALVFFSVRAVTTATLNGLTDSTLKPAATAAVHEIFSSLRGWAVFLFWVGLLVAVVLYLAGPGRLPTALRGKVADGSRWTVDRVQTVRADEGAAAWVAANLDALRVGGAVVAAILLFLFGTWLALAVVGVLLVLFEVGVTLWATSTPAPPPEVTTAGVA